MNGLSITYTLLVVMGCGVLVFFGALVWLFVDEVRRLERSKRR